MALQRIHRLLHLITLLQSGGFHTTSDLMSVLKIGRRTLFRDLKMLEAAGIPYYYERGKGYQIIGNFFLQPVNLTVGETLGLLLTIKTTLSQHRNPMASSTLSALWKLMASVPQPIRTSCNEIMESVSVTPAATAVSTDEDCLFRQLQTFILQRRVIRLTYARPQDTTAQMLDVHPYALHFGVRAWYLLAYSVEHEEVRMFKLGRIQNVEEIKRRFSMPKFKVQDKIGLAWQLIAEGKVHAIELAFSAKVAINVSEVHWHESQSVEFQSDGSCLMRFEVDGLNEIAWWICGYADQVKVVKPKPLKSLVKKMLQQAASQYQT